MNHKPLIMPTILWVLTLSKKAFGSSFLALHVSTTAGGNLTSTEGTDQLTLVGVTQSQLTASNVKSV